MEEVMYFELCTDRLQVVPKAGLVPIDDYREVERPWGQVSFDLIDIRGVGDYIALPCYREVERGNRRLARLHWDEEIPPKLRKAKTFWVGPIGLCIPFHYRREGRQETDARVQM